MADKKLYAYSDAELIDQKLVVEIGSSYIVLVAGTENKIGGVEFFEVATTDLDEALEEIKNQSDMLHRSYSETKVFYNLDETVLIPAAQFNTSIAAELLDVAFGAKPNSQVNVENINISPALVNVYRSNEQWQEVISNYFRAASKKHLHSALAEQVINDKADVTVHIYPHHITVAAAKERQLKIVRNFEYNNDADVLYHLLNVCKQVDLVTDDITLDISGFINKDSSLYQLLNKYFHTRLNTSEKLPQSKYPSHYFTSFFKLLS